MFGVLNSRCYSDILLKITNEFFRKKKKPNQLDLLLGSHLVLKRVYSCLKKTSTFLTIIFLNTAKHYEGRDLVQGRRACMDRDR